MVVVPNSQILIVIIIISKTSEKFLQFQKIKMRLRNSVLQLAVSAQISSELWS